MHHWHSGCVLAFQAKIGRFNSDMMLQIYIGDSYSGITVGFDPKERSSILLSPANLMGS